MEISRFADILSGKSFFCLLIIGRHISLQMQRPFFSIAADYNSLVHPLEINALFVGSRTVSLVFIMEFRLYASVKLCWSLCRMFVNISFNPYQPSDILFALQIVCLLTLLKGYLRQKNTFCLL